jgi:prolipoprotein diacylglyceryl transferase
VSSLLASIPPPPAPGLEIGPLDLRFYGLLIAIGAYLALRLAVSRYEKLGGDPELAERALLIGLGCGLVGSRIGYVIPRAEQFLREPLEIFAIWHGGLTIFGGLFFGALGALVYLRRKQMDVPAMLTAAAPALPLAQGIGRWGNYFNQELYGRPTDLPWALEVEPNFRRPGYEQFSTFHPTFLYESLWNLSLVVVLLWIDRRGVLKRGSLIFVYMIGYGVGRGWIEALRIDTVERYAGLSRNNWIALLIVVVGAVGLWWWERRESPADDVRDDSETGAAASTEESAGDAAGDVADVGATGTGDRTTDAGSGDDSARHHGDGEAATTAPGEVTVDDAERDPDDGADLGVPDRGSDDVDGPAVDERPTRPEA